MFKNYFKGIEGIATYPMFTLVVFFLFFLGLSIWLIRADKKKLDEIGQLPLQESADDSKPSQS
ncbi:MAG: CcoQ/FixQ family Cbb3-type cytochrome c oxidase assembly chaperone [Bacteroidetes bacterium]|nr:CcoQ/FixQ family Cbb3-type cytochrome c oxidase assembly chaperone [Bacteroidota bacterium]